MKFNAVLFLVVANMILFTLGVPSGLKFAVFIGISVAIIFLLAQDIPLLRPFFDRDDIGDEDSRSFVEKKPEVNA